MSSFNENRYDNMNYVPCGKWGLKLPRLSLGCWHNFGGADVPEALGKSESEMHANAQALLFGAFDLGITHFDLANNYGPPAFAAEERVGRILKDMPRDELVISTKAGHPCWPGPYGKGGSKKYLLSSLDHSLKALDLEYVDIFYHHCPDPETPMEESMGALDQVVRSGKALYVGISSYRGHQVQEAFKVCEENGFVKPVIHQPAYNMLDRWIEDEVVPLSEEYGYGIVAFQVLKGGVLAGKYLKEIPKDSRAAYFAHTGKLAKNEAWRSFTQKLADFAQKRGQTLSQLALAWALNDSRITSVIMGASRLSQLEENVQVLGHVDFSSEELAELHDLLDDPPTEKDL